MNGSLRTAITVGNSVAVTMPPDFIKPGEKVHVSRYKDVVTLRPARGTTSIRFATDKEVLEKFKELEKRYGKLYDDLAHMP